MLTKRGDKTLLKSHELIFEPKLDGYRALCVKKNGKLSFYSRNGLPMTEKYPELQHPKLIKATSAILDGEIIAYGPDGMPHFQALQQGKPAVYIVFDIIEKDGKSLINEPLTERKKILKATVRNGTEIEKIFDTSDGEALWKQMVKHRLEGVMAKVPDSRYYPNERTGVWLKIKIHETVDAVIVGYTSGRREISALVLGLYDGKQLTYIGKVGTGFNEATMAELAKKFSSRQRAGPPKGFNPLKKIKDVQWLSPTMACEIKYANVTGEGILRAPVFLRIRTDKTAKQCSMEQIKRRESVPSMHKRAQ